MIKVPPKRIGETLIEKGLITQDQLNIALIEQKSTLDQIGKTLVLLGFIGEDVLRDQLGINLSQQSINLKNMIPDPIATGMIDRETARRLRILPVSFSADQKKLTVAMSDTFNIMTIDTIATMVGHDIEIDPVLAADADLDYALDRFYGLELSIDGILHELDALGRIDSNDIVRDEIEHPLVRLINVLLFDAVRKDASDIHFEPESKYLRIRYRIDGVLHQIRCLHEKYWPAMSVRLKIISGMDITESRTPQDGRITLNAGSHEIYFRAASQPTLYGENIVLRILDQKKGIVPFDQLQLSGFAFKQLQLMMARPEGIIIVTGPTGSGKTTTLYSMLNHLNNERVNIMTLEDPVEYKMTMVRQSSVNPSLKMDFASGIRSLMRQDPDIILVGEVRDEDTATMAFRAAMTGHKVFTTLHSNSSVASFTRLVDIGVKSGIMTGNIIGIVAQRLVRRLCTQCRESYQPSAPELKLLGLTESVTLYRSKGCIKCNHTGYKGRLAIMEVLRIDAELDNLIAHNATAHELEAQARKSGFKTIAQEGISRIIDGSTSLDELSRIADLTHLL